MGSNVYFSHGTKNEQYLLEDIIIESISIYGQTMYYIPRQLVAKDNILGEDRLSKFTDAYPIDIYLESVDGFEGQGAFIQKFGLMMEQSATLTVARRTWEKFIGRHNDIMLPNRPAEGDLLYFPLTKGLFEIKFVEHQDPFYQLRKLYVYRLQVELFQYASERIETGNAEIDVFQALKTQDVNDTSSYNRVITGFNIVSSRTGYDANTTVQITSSIGTGATAEAVVVGGKIVEVNVMDGGFGYKDESTVQVSIIGTGSGAQVTPIVGLEIDKVQSYGDNTSFQQEALDVVFDVSNPFGE